MIPNRHAIGQIIHNDDSALSFLQTNSILPTISSCPLDSYSLSQIAPCRFKCRKKNCRKIYSILTGTILASCRVSYSDYVYLMYSFICEVPIKSMLFMTGHSKKTIHRILKVLEIYCQMKLRTMKKK